MKKVLKNVSFVFLLLKMCIIFGQETSAQKRIIIDVGHGGKDSGAIGVNDIQEKDVVLGIANAILRLNNELEKPLNIYLTRYSDTLISLSDRTKLAKILKADLFVSLHCNHSDNPDARGVEVYASKKQGKYSRQSVFIGFQIEKALCKTIGYESRGVKFGDFQVIRETVNYCPSLLLELSFLSNRDEGSYISDALNIQFIASTILLSIQN
ncbi:N-acetylmuramoyl-L-alanine amidase [Subsaximicrobium wynnwilliamsii]|uniref:N-acetylmuramoyl-L-alanine amidase n=1 Tax=Subsaximicrobium wynnwilliamsii TaxID=291179 RepID=A0A5C6ZAQ1_9FLAO|nr:N-acetylmuramoyl-L-alanine amidase [Subsaximicrobium wynnwilliamsii]TXD84485.1 N-acetylmuramoyl-L-alanine amidase [Subsaximicrobium wynnwilliamsii]TXD86571.1 N-acetylmuramoyl-L-alanine amidase [Subsaximicrobium wynnwilliamsii]TXE04218.1 N-acetylmuramoyl-L-alanine amidase [Subsaximicrobium wynnwilliamsii]